MGASGLQLHSHSQAQKPYTQEIAATNWCAISLVVSRFRFVVATLVTLVTFSVSFVPGLLSDDLKIGEVRHVIRGFITVHFMMGNDFLLGETTFVGRLEYV